MDFMPNQKTIIRQTQKWLSSIVIAHEFCPFAKREFDAGRIHYAVIEAANLKRQLEAVMRHCIALDCDMSRETSLLIFPNGLSEFEVYLDLLQLANILLKDQDYEGQYQLASFHPQYLFDGVVKTDPSHYTNRSPYPMLHILRESSVEKALESFPNPEKIPSRNIELTQELGLKKMQALFAACYK